MQFCPENLEQNTNRSKIFMVAARLFAERGYNGVSMREISEYSGLSKPTIYYYFGNKEGIYKSLLETGLTHGSENIRRILNMNIPVKQKLVEIVKTRFNHCIQYPEFTKFYLSLFINLEKMPFLDDFIKEANEKRLILINLFQKGVDNGEFGAGADPDLAVEIFTGTMTYFIWKQLNTEEKFLTDRLAEDIVELLFKGLNE